MAKVAIVGAGLVGRSWAVIFARAGWRVSAYDPSPEIAAGMLDQCQSSLAALSLQGLCEDVPGALSRIDMKPSLEAALEGADYVQESGPEQIELKQALFAEMDRLADPQAILASSTTAIQCSRFTEALPGRARCLVVHPVNPPHLVPLVEVSGALWTDPAIIERARQVQLELGQTPIVVRKEIEGFILNRLQAAVLTEAFRLVAEGYVAADELDAVMTHGLAPRWSFMGPLETIDLNAPGGMADYCRRFGPYLRSFATSLPGFSWDEAGIEQVVRAYAATHEETAGRPERMLARDERLAVLARRRLAGD